MITLPKEFVATKYPGYFFNRDDQKLYSLKISGILKELKYRYPNRWNYIGQYPTKLADGTKIYSKGGYQVSVKGQTRFYAIEQLKEIKEHDATIPVKEKVNG